MSPLSGLAAYLPQLTLSTIFSVLFLVILANGIYNRYFHPLSHIPGPFWASVSDFWKIWFVSTKECHTRSVEYHKKYGPVVRAAPNLVAFSDPKFIPTVYHRQVDKTDFYSTGIFGETITPMQALKHAHHAALRKRVAPSFSITNLRKIESQIDNMILEFVDTLRERFATTGKKLDFGEWSKWFMYDVVTDVTFGEPIGFVREGKDIGKLLQAFHELAPLAGLIAALPWLMNPLLKNDFFGRRFLMPKAGDSRGGGRIMEYRDKMLEDRLKHRFEQKTGDFIGNIMNARNPDGTYLTTEEVKAEALILMTAASDNSSAFFVPFIQNVTQDSRIYAKLMEEINSYEKDGKFSLPVPRIDEIQDLRYLTACIKETIRHSPSAPFIFPRMVSKGGLKVSGYFIPQDSEIGANPYIVHRDKDIFGDDAEVFRPERWIESEDREKLMDRYILTWGYGTRICMGKNIAEMIMRKLCLQLLRNFHIESADPKNPWKCANMALMVYWDHWLKLTVREEVAKANGTPA